MTLRHIKHFFFIFLILSLGLMEAASESKAPLILNTSAHKNSTPEEVQGAGYTINFDNVPIIEVVKFISKVGKLNFIYEEDLQFNVSMVSEEPTPLVHVIAAFVQVLRVNGFDLIEQGHNLVITRGSGLKQIASVYSDETAQKEGQLPPLMTRVFTIKNANPTILAGIIRPLLSDSAVIEVSEATRNIIVTDLTQNIEEIQKLFSTLDTPKAPLSIESYHCRSNAPETLISLANQILIPISEDNPLIFVPQNSTRLIYIISTPFLISQSIKILEELDSPPSILRGIEGPITQENFLLYPIKHKAADLLIQAIKLIEENLEKMGPPAQNVIASLKTLKFIEQSHALFFTGEAESLREVNSLLEGLDHADSGDEAQHENGELFFYPLQHEDEESISRTLQKLTQNLKASGHQDYNLISTLESMKYIKENQTLMFIGDKKSIERLKQLLPLFDVSQASQSKLPLSNEFYIFRPQYESGERLLSQIKTTAKILKASNFTDLAFLKTLHSAMLTDQQAITFIGDQESIDKVKTLVSEIDLTAKEKSEELKSFPYQIQYVSFDYLEKGLQGIALSLPEGSPLKKPLESLRYIKETNTVVFKGSPEAIQEIKSILSSIDQASEKPDYLVYKLQKANGAQILKNIKEVAKSIKIETPLDKQLTQAMLGVCLIESTNSLLISGPSFAVEKIREMVEQDDNPEAQPSTVFVYIPKGLSPLELQKNILTAAKEISASGLQNKELLNTMESVKVVSNGKAVMFTGTTQGIELMKGIVEKFDDDSATVSQPSSFFIYHPSSVTAEKLSEDLIKAAHELERSGLQDPELIHAMLSAHVISSGSQVTFTGTPGAIGKIKGMVSHYDNQKESTKPSDYLIFNPKDKPPQEIIQESKSAAAQMKENGLADPNLLAALNSATLVSEGRGILYIGTLEAIKQVESLASSFDHPKNSPDVSHFFIYEPIHTSAQTLQSQTSRVAGDMQESGFSDRGLIHTLQKPQIVSGGKKLLFTGTKEAIDKVQTLIPSLDAPSDIEPKHVGKTTFRIFKVKHLKGPILMEYLKNMASDLQKAGSTQSDLILTLNNMRYVKDTNSIIFTGSPQSVQEAIDLAQKFDIPSLAQEAPPRSPSGYLVYKPKYVHGEELIRILHDFQGNLETSGLNDRALFDVIQNTKWMAKTSSILISGHDEETKKVYDLLESFDTPRASGSKDDTTIETVSDASFLIYKLQYHPGDEIRTAIRQIGTDLERTNTNSDLGKAIQTLQWIEVTNSLVATGSPESLGKLKELIRSVDIPLKQVFVEVLVIQTQNADQLEFGLHWGSQGTYKNKFSYGMYNQPVDTTSNLDPLAAFNTNIQKLTTTTTPTGQMIPISSGGDLGVIGDLILHKGKTHLALGSLVNAIKNDGDSTIVMNQKIITQDNKMSTIFSGQNIPYTGSLVTNSGSNTVKTANLEYRDVGIRLSITPVVGNNDVITLMIEEDISEDVTNGQGNSFTPDQVQGIKTSKNTTKVVVSVPDKSFLVLSGSIQDSNTRNKTGIPCLGGLPLVGAAFSEKSHFRSVSNIVFFVRPQIIKSFDVYSEITQQQEEIFRGYSGDKEDFDVGLELVKTADDSY